MSGKAPVKAGREGKKRCQEPLFIPRLPVETVPDTFASPLDFDDLNAFVTVLPKYHGNRNELVLAFDPAENPARPVQLTAASTKTTSWWGGFKEWLQSWGSTVAVPAPVGAAEAAPGVGKAALLRKMQERAVRIELKFGVNSQEAKYAWEEYEAAKAGKLAEFHGKNPPPPPPFPTI